jgi:hypothetical protein
VIYLIAELAHVHQRELKESHDMIEFRIDCRGSHGTNMLSGQYLYVRL